MCVTIHFDFFLCFCFEFINQLTIFIGQLTFGISRTSWNENLFRRWFPGTLRYLFNLLAEHLGWFYMSEVNGLGLLLSRLLLFLQISFVFLSQVCLLLRSKQIDDTTNVHSTLTVILTDGQNTRPSKTFVLFLLTIIGKWRLTRYRAITVSIVDTKTTTEATLIHGTACRSKTNAAVTTSTETRVVVTKTRGLLLLAKVVSAIKTLATVHVTRYHGVDVTSDLIGYIDILLRHVSNSLLILRWIHLHQIWEDCYDVGCTCFHHKLDRCFCCLFNRRKCIL